MGYRDGVREPITETMGFLSVRRWLRWSRLCDLVFMLPLPGRGSALPRVFALYSKAWAWGLPWPWSLVYQIGFVTAYQAVIVTLALGTYFAFSRTLRTRNLLRALIVVFVALGSGNAALPFLFVALSSIGLRTVYGSFVLLAIPTLVAVLLGTWQANLGELEILETAESSATPKSLPKS